MIVARIFRKNEERRCVINLAHLFSYQLCKIKFNYKGDFYMKDEYIGFRIPEEEKNKLTEEAEKEDMSVSQLIRKCIRFYFKNKIEE